MTSKKSNANDLFHDSSHSLELLFLKNRRSIQSIEKDTKEGSRIQEGHIIRGRAAKY